MFIMTKVQLAGHTFCSTSKDSDKVTVITSQMCRAYPRAEAEALYRELTRTSKSYVLPNYEVVRWSGHHATRDKWHTLPANAGFIFLYFLFFTHV